eukprot:CAMPEP_0172498204 /NCGR_PEP_ID=MMETSP1066-20121228/110705_1 /TAXON_ID=671091 /ORGANISM="Coscinodiscus wailesii, Strain CCMP2513" /LENGTH=222 /DNA_ID=CAMNT_0013271395 /DNA_START=45 /DNA_END=713 /DNA_ORIENTATION=+
MIIPARIFAILFILQVTSASVKLRKRNEEKNTNDAELSSAQNVPRAAPILTPSINERYLKEETQAPSAYFGCNGRRWQLWEDIDDDKYKRRAEKMGYNKTTWNIPGTADIEDNSWWGLVKIDMDVVAGKIGWESDVWDCYVNHYEDYTWDEIEEWGLKKAFKRLGFDREKWANASFATLRDGSKWDDLSEKEQWAADQICYVRGSWEVKALNEWEWKCPEDV